MIEHVTEDYTEMIWCSYFQVKGMIWLILEDSTDVTYMTRA